MLAKAGELSDEVGRMLRTMIRSLRAERNEIGHPIDRTTRETAGERQGRSGQLHPIP
jgi:hypothetical protein